MRGTLLPCRLVLADARIIPADAGNTQPLFFTISTNGDHPRGCGEHKPPLVVGAAE